MNWTTVEVNGGRRYHATGKTADYSIYVQDGAVWAVARIGGNICLDVRVPSVADAKALIAVFDALVVLPAHLGGNGV